VVGTWVADSCGLTVGGMANLSSAGIGCVAAPATGWLTVSGTWSAMADGTYMDATTTTGDVVLELAKECLMISGFFGTCDRLVLESAGLFGADPNAPACVDNAATEGCTCTFRVNQTGGMAAVSYEASSGQTATGTYTAADNKVTVTAAPISTEYSYCVAGSTMTMTVDTVSNVGAVTGPIVLQKQ
jgi:hypothetical protein